MSIHNFESETAVLEESKTRLSNGATRCFPISLAYTRKDSIWSCQHRYKGRVLRSRFITLSFALCFYRSLSFSPSLSLSLARSHAVNMCISHVNFSQLMWCVSTFAWLWWCCYWFLLQWNCVAFTWNHTFPSLAVDLRQHKNGIHAISMSFEQRTLLHKLCHSSCVSVAYIAFTP